MADLTMYLAEQNPNMMTDAIRKINKPKGLYNKHDYLEYVRFFYESDTNGTVCVIQIPDDGKENCEQ